MENNEGVEGNIPPLIKRPQEDLRAYAERSGLFNDKGETDSRRRGPTKKSVNPMLVLGTL